MPNPFIPLSITAFREELALLLAHPPELPRNHSARQVAEYQTRLAHYRSVWRTVNRYRAVLCEKPAVSTLVPTLLLRGSHERIFAKPSSERMTHCLPGAQTRILPDQGHLPHLEAPVDTSRQLADFVQGR